MNDSEDDTFRSFRTIAQENMVVYKQMAARIFGVFKTLTSVLSAIWLSNRSVYFLHGAAFRFYGFGYSE